MDYKRSYHFFLITCTQRDLTCIWCPLPIWTFTASAQCRSLRRTFICGTSIMPELNWSCGLWVRCAGTDETLHALPLNPEGKSILFLHSMSIIGKYLLWSTEWKRPTWYVSCLGGKKRHLVYLHFHCSEEMMFTSFRWCHRQSYKANKSGRRYVKLPFVEIIAQSSQTERNTTHSAELFGASERLADVLSDIVWHAVISKNREKATKDTFVSGRKWA